MLPDYVRDELINVKPASVHTADVSYVSPERIAAIDKIVANAKRNHPTRFVTSFEEDLRYRGGLRRV
jgi:hypothetical protein